MRDGRASDWGRIRRKESAMSGARPKLASLRPRVALREAGDAVVSEGKARVRRPGLGRYWWRVLHRIERPPPQVIEDAPHDTRIVDQGDDPHRPLALWALRGIGFIDFANQPRPGGPGARGELAHRFDGCCGLRLGILTLEGQLPARRVGQNRRPSWPAADPLR